MEYVRTVGKLATIIQKVTHKSADHQINILPAIRTVAIHRPPKNLYGFPIKSPTQSGIQISDQQVSYKGKQK